MAEASGDLKAAKEFSSSSISANDSKNASLPPSQAERDGLAGAMLRNDSIPTGAATYLNPSFVEEMMGAGPLGFWELAEALAGRGYISPLATVGVVAAASFERPDRFPASSTEATEKAQRPLSRLL